MAHYSSWNDEPTPRPIICKKCKEGERDEDTGAWVYPPMKRWMHWQRGDGGNHSGWQCSEDDEHFAPDESAYYTTAPDFGPSDADPGL